MESSVYRNAPAQAALSVQPWGALNWLANRQLLHTTGLTLGRVVIKSGHANPRHRHNNGEEVLYLLAGKLRHSIGTESVTLDAGDTLRIPAGVFHHAESIGAVDADMIVAYSTADRDFELETPAG